MSGVLIASGLARVDRRVGKGRRQACCGTGVRCGVAAALPIEDIGSLVAAKHVAKVVAGEEELFHGAAETERRRGAQRKA